MVEGRCQSWGAACTPTAGQCVFNPADGLHHACKDPKSGGCGTWGDLCKP